MTLDDDHCNVGPYFGGPDPRLRTVRENLAAGTDVGEPVTAMDDGDAIEYSLSGSSRFRINTSTGQITTTESLDREEQSSYSVTVTATDEHDATGMVGVDITVRDVNEPPEITGGATAPTNEEGRTRSVATYTATDPEGANISWSLPNTSFETDRSDFSISSSGELSFNSLPNYESPPASNVYKVTVRASDGSLSASRNVTVTVTNRVPTINSGPSSPSYAEGGTGPVGTYTASDLGGGAISWSLPNTAFETDRSDFSISGSGVLSFNTSPDYETPHDSNRNNVYKVTVRASDGSLSASRNVTVTVTNEPPTINSGPSSPSYAEGGTDPVGSYTASDPGGGAISWSLPNTIFQADRSDFSISNSGVLSFNTSPDYESPHDSDRNNMYKVTVRASAAGGFDDRNVTVRVANEDEPGVVSLFRLGKPPVPVTGSVTAGTLVAADVDDPDGIVGTVGWTWSRRPSSGGSWTNVGTGDSYTTSDSDADHTIRARASYRDEQDRTALRTATSVSLGVVAAEPPSVSVSKTSPLADDVFEGNAVILSVSATTALESNLTVGISIRVDGDYLEDGVVLPTSLTIPASTSFVHVELATDDDRVDELDGEIEVVINAGSGYEVASADPLVVPVRDNDLPAPTGIGANGNVVNGQVETWWNFVTGIDGERATAYRIRWGEEVCSEGTFTNCGFPADATWEEFEGIVVRVWPLTAGDGRNDQLDLHKSYHFQVQAYNEHEKSPWSDGGIVHPTERPPVGSPSHMFPKVSGTEVSFYLPKNDDGLHEFAFSVCTNRTLPPGISLSALEVAQVVHKWQTAITKDASGTRMLDTTWNTEGAVDDITCALPVVRGIGLFFPGFNSILFATDEQMLQAKCTIPDYPLVQSGCWRHQSSWIIWADAVDALGSNYHLAVPEYDGTILIREAPTIGGNPTAWNDAAYNGGCKRSQSTITHEVGHAFGLGVTDGYYEDIHPDHAADSLMSLPWTIENEYCESQVFDEVALMATYQSR